MQSYIKAKKNQLNIFGFLKIIAFLAVLSFLVFRIAAIDRSEYLSLRLDNLWPFIAAIFLMPLNWFFEFQKWKLSTDSIEDKVPFKRISHAFYAGMITGLMTPNMIGNFIGRMYYFPRKERGLITLLTLIGSQSQFLITLVLGLLSIIIAPFTAELIGDGFIFWLVISAVLVTGLFSYFFIEKILVRFAKTRKLGLRLEQVFSKTRGFRRKVLFLSLIRYIVFISQFSFVLMSFGIDFEPQLLLGIAQVYLISALIPTLILGKFGVRESVGMIILSSIGIPDVTIIAGSLLVWLINLIIPTLLATMLIKRNS